jgi:hypothetical protein
MEFAESGSITKFLLKSNGNHLSQAWGNMPVIPALGRPRWRQEDHKFKARLRVHRDPASQKEEIISLWMLCMKKGESHLFLF